MRAALFRNEEPGDLALHRVVTKTAPGSASACTRAAYWRRRRTAGPVSTPMGAVSNGLPVTLILALQFNQRALDRQRRPRRALGVVLVRDRIAKQPLPLAARADSRLAQEIALWRWV